MRRLIECSTVHHSIHTIRHLYITHTNTTMSLLSSVLGFGAFGFGARCFQLGLQKRNMFDGMFGENNSNTCHGYFEERGLTTSTTRTRSSNSSIRIIRLRSIRNGKEAVRPHVLGQQAGCHLTKQGVPTSRQEEAINGNSRKGEPGIPGKTCDHINGNGDGLGRGRIGCTSFGSDMQHYDRN